MRNTLGTRIAAISASNTRKDPGDEVQIPLNSIWADPVCRSLTRGNFLLSQPLSLKKTLVSAFLLLKFQFLSGRIKKSLVTVRLFLFSH